MRNFNSQEGVFKPILGIKIAPEAIPIQNEEHQNVQSRVNIKDRQYASLLQAVLKYQEAKKKRFEEGDPLDLSECDWLHVVLEAQYAESIDQRVKDAYFRMNEEARNVKVKVES